MSPGDGRDGMDIEFGLSTGSLLGGGTLIANQSVKRNKSESATWLVCVFVYW